MQRCFDRWCSVFYIRLKMVNESKHYLHLLLFNIRKGKNVVHVRNKLVYILQRRVECTSVPGLVFKISIWKVHHVQVDKLFKMRCIYFKAWHLGSPQVQRNWLASTQYYLRVILKARRKLSSFEANHNWKW